MTGTRAAAALAATILCTSAADAGAQTIRGRVVDAATGGPVSAARVSARDRAGNPAGATTTDSLGAFELRLATGRAWLLSTTHPLYAGSAPADVVLGAAEILEIVIRIAPSVVTIDPLVVTTRRRSLMEEETFAGAMARYQAFSMYGPRRVILQGEPEFIAATTIGGMVGFTAAQSGGGRGRCLIVWVNGELQRTPERAASWLAESVNYHEAVEIYRRVTDAPAGYREVPVWVISPSSCGVVALWPKEARYPEGPERDRWNRNRLLGVLAFVVLLTAAAR